MNKPSKSLIHDRMKMISYTFLIIVVLGFLFYFSGYRLIGKYTIIIGAVASIIKDILNGIKQKTVEVHLNSDTPKPAIVFRGKKIVFGIIINLMVFVFLLAIVWTFM